MTIHIDHRDYFTYSEARRMAARERAAAFRVFWRRVRGTAERLFARMGTPAPEAGTADGDTNRPRRRPTCQAGSPRDLGPAGTLASEGRVFDEFGRPGGRRAVATLGAALCR